MKRWYECAKARMEELDMTQVQLAERMSVSKGAISHWFNGRSEPTVERIRELADVLDASVAEWFEDDPYFIRDPALREIVDKARRFTPEELDEAARFLDYLAAKSKNPPT